MNKYKYIANYLFIFVIMSLFAFITVPKMLNHVPNNDESHNYIVSYFMNMNNFADILAFNGHAILWYLIIMPFAKINFLYPYPMLIINYLAIFIALLIMWLKAPFNKYIKTIITFSYMITVYYAVNARCYSIGILGFFLLCAMYKERIKKPFLYSIIIGLTANTHPLATIGVSCILLLFLYDIFRNIKHIDKKQILFTLLSLSVSFYILIFPHIYNITVLYPADFNRFFDETKDFFFNNIFIIPYFIVFLILLLNKSDEDNRTFFIHSKFFLIYTFIAMWIFMYIYANCTITHRYFFFVYLIITMWIQGKYDNFNFKDTIFYILFSIIMLSHYGGKLEGIPKIMEFGKILKNEKSEYSNSIIIFAGNPDYHLYPLAPFLINKEGITLYNGNEKYSYMMRYYNLSEDDIKNIAGKTNKNVYIFKENFSVSPQVQIKDFSKYPLYKNYNDMIYIYKVK